MRDFKTWNFIFLRCRRNWFWCNVLALARTGEEWRWTLLLRVDSDDAFNIIGSSAKECDFGFTKKRNLFEVRYVNPCRVSLYFVQIFLHFAERSNARTSRKVTVDSNLQASFTVQTFLLFLDALAQDKFAFFSHAPFVRAFAVLAHLCCCKERGTERNDGRGGRGR